MEYIRNHDYLYSWNWKMIMKGMGDFLEVKGDYEKSLELVMVKEDLKRLLSCQR